MALVTPERNFSLWLLEDRSLVDNLQENCTYTGVDENAHRASRVLVSTCLGSTWAYVSRERAEWTLDQNQTVHKEEPIPKNGCVEEGGNHTLEEDGNYTLVMNEQVSGPDEDWQVVEPPLKRKFVRVHLVTDNKFSAYREHNSQAVDKATLNIASTMAFIYRQMPGFYNVTVQVASVYHFRTNYAPWDGIFEASYMLAEFAKWALQRRKQPNEAFHLLTSADLLGSTVGIARLRAYCTGGAYGLTQATYTDVGSGKIMAHELGHNLGLHHTNVYMEGTAMGTPEEVQPCSQIPQALMNPYIMGTQAIWDRCSVDWFRMQQEGYPYKCQGGQCTYQPSAAGCYDTPLDGTCGNGQKEKGEECDSDHKCCKGCKLQGACDPTVSKCCNEYCQPARKGKLCHRRRHPLCDSRARCDGKSVECPLSRPLREGGECTIESQAGKCSRGRCLSHDVQCAQMSTLFPQKDVRGACPRANGGDVGCGKLYCLYGSWGFCDSFTVGGSQVYVEEGTPCAPGLFCRDRKCLPPIHK